MTNEGAWSLSEVVAQRVRRGRLRQGMNRDQLAAACQQLGAPSEGPRAVSVHTIANIETGRPDSTGRRRRDVTVDELVIFARALGVPPLALIYPVDTGDPIEGLPGVTVDSWAAAKWFTAEAPFPVPPEDEDREFISWARGAGVFVVLRKAGPRPATEPEPPTLPDHHTQRRQRMTRKFLRRVADVYRAALAEGEAPTKAVAKHFTAAQSTAGRWVVEARRAGELGPAIGPTPGEVGT